MAHTRRQSSTWRAACMLVAAACLLGAASAGRRLAGFGPVRPTKVVWTASPGNLSATMGSCAWDGFSCGTTMAPIFAKGAPLISAENYPARAFAFISAGDAFCSQFSESKCSYPCQYASGVCRINDASMNQVFNCPGSVVYEEINCISPLQQSAASCLVQPTCSYSSQRSGNDVCTSTYAANLTDSQYQWVFGELQFAVMPKQLMGCCKGSVFRWQMNNFCDAAFDSNGNSSPQACAKVPGCVWDINTADGCVPSPQTTVKLQFAYQPADPLVPALSALGGECAAIKDEATCSAYKPVQLDAAKVKQYLGISQRLNSPIADKQCPLPSQQLPNM